MRVEIDTAHVASVKIGLRATQVTDGRVQTPIEHRICQGPIECVEAQGRKVEDSCLISRSCARKSLQAAEGARRNISIMFMREGKRTEHFRVHAVGPIAVKDQPGYVARLVFDGSSDTCAERQIHSPIGGYVNAALIDEPCCRRRRDTAVEQGIPAHDQMVEPGSFVAKIAVRRKAAL